MAWCENSVLNGNVATEDVIRRIKNELDVRTCVETGTYIGNSTLFFSNLFETVHTVELNPEFQNRAKGHCRDQTNITFHTVYASQQETLTSQRAAVTR